MTLNQRRIFIIPTRQGLGFVCVLLVMLLGDINYNLSLGYVLTFLLGTTALMTMVHTFRNMAQLEIRAGRTESVFSGDMAEFVFYFHNTGKLARYHLKLTGNNGQEVIFDLAAQQGKEVKLPIPAAQRGWLSSGRLTLSTEFPLGLYHAWSYLQFDTRCLVYPKPSPPHPLPVNSALNGTGKLPATGDEDFSGLRNYVAGDPLPRIAWKAFAREQGLQVKQFSALQGQELWLEWEHLPALSVERKLQILTRWVLDADVQGLQYGLRLPDIKLSAGQGALHRLECLRALALYGSPA